MAIGAAHQAKTRSALPSRRAGGGALSAAGLIAMTIAGLGFLALVSIFGSAAVVADGAENGEVRPSLFCPLQGGTIDFSAPVATSGGPTQD